MFSLKVTSWTENHQLGMIFELLKAASNGYPTKHKTDGSTHACSSSSILSFFPLKKRKFGVIKVDHNFQRKIKLICFYLKLRPTNGKYMWSRGLQLLSCRSPKKSYKELESSRSNQGRNLYPHVTLFKGTYRYPRSQSY